MTLRYDKTLITGKPGVSKTTLIQKIVEQAGFEKDPHGPITIT
jgi:nucleoside-triphosphatase THEP1